MYDKPYKYLTEDHKREVEKYINKHGFNLEMNLHQLKQLTNRAWVDKTKITAEDLYYIFIDKVVTKEIESLGYNQEDALELLKVLDKEVYNKMNQDYQTDLGEYVSYIQVLKEVKRIEIKN